MLVLPHDCESAIGMHPRPQSDKLPTHRLKEPVPRPRRHFLGCRRRRRLGRWRCLGSCKRGCDYCGWGACLCCGWGPCVCCWRGPCLCCGWGPCVRCWRGPCLCSRRTGLRSRFRSCTERARRRRAADGFCGGGGILLCKDEIGDRSRGSCHGYECCHALLLLLEQFPLPSMPTTLSLDSLVETHLRRGLRAT
jgi:hypothetical protein